MSLADILDNIVSISTFSRGQASKNFEKIKRGPVVVVKNNSPEAVILTTKEYIRLTEIEEDHALLTEALQRMEAADSSIFLSHEDMKRKLNITDEDLSDIEVELL